MSWSALLSQIRSMPKRDEQIYEVNGDRATTQQRSIDTLYDSCVSTLQNHPDFYCQRKNLIEIIPYVMRSNLLEGYEKKSLVTNELLDLLCCPGITKVDLFRCPNITSKGIRFIAERCTNLKEFRLSDCAGCNNDQEISLALTQVVKSCTQLTHFTLSMNPNITDHDISMILRALQKSNVNSTLVHLDFTGCSQLTDRTLTTIATLFGSQQQYSNQQAFQLQSYNMRWNENISSVGFHQLVFLCRFLKQLDFSFCPKIDSNCLIDIGDYLPELQILKLEHNRHVSENSLIYFLSKCKQLRFLRLRNIDGISDMVLETLSQHCQDIEILNIAGCHQVTNEGVFYIASKCHKIERLSLMGIQSITDEAIYAIQSNCPSLMQLDIYNCPKITQICKSQISSVDVSSLPQGSLKW